MNSQQIIATFESTTGNKATFKNGTFKKSFLKYNLKLLKEGDTQTYLDPLKFYNPLSKQLNNHKLKKNTITPTPTKASLEKVKKLRAEADFDYVSKNGDLVKIPESQKKNPIPFLEENFNTKSLDTLKGYKKKNYSLLKSIPSSKKINLILEVKFDLYYNGVKNKSFSFNVGSQGDVFSADAEELSADDYNIELVEGWWGGDLRNGDLEAKDIEVRYFSKKSGQELKLEDMKLFLGNPLNISSLYNEIITKDYKDCVYDYLIDKWGKLSKKQKNLLKDKRTINELYDFCVTYHIKLIAYDISGNIIKAHYPLEYQKKYSNLVFIAYNQHLYPLKNKVLHKVFYPDNKLELCNIPDAHEKFVSVVEQGWLPKVIKVNTDGLVLAFIYDYTLYFENCDYDKCKEILERMGMGDRMKWSVTLNTITSIFEEYYTNGSNINSYWINSRQYNKTGFTYKVDDYQQNNDLTQEEYVTCDKNKAYSNSLINLPFLISVDFKTNRTHEYKNTIIESHYLYVVEVTVSNILLPNTNVYTGMHIMICKDKGLVEGKDFIIKEYIETTKHPNYLSQMITDIYDKVDKNTAKQMVNVYIGKMERATNVDDYLKPVKIIDEEEMKTYTGSYKCLGRINGNNYYVCLDLRNIANVTNKKPIAIQIKDCARLTLFEFMQNNDISNDDVIQVKTDSITFKKKNNKYLEYLSQELDGWKLEDFKEIVKSRKYNKEALTLNYKKIKKLVNTIPYKKNCICLGYGGNGKSTFIIRHLIPKILEDNESYQVLTPSHASANQYRKLELEIRVIQGYSFRNNIPDADHIIVDEIGMVSSNDWLVIIKCILLGKHVYCFGDFNQLSPVKSSKITKNFLYSLFDYEVWLTENYRNNYNTDYYKKLITTNESQYLIDEVKRASMESWDNNTILVSYRNSVRHKYNKEICDKLKTPYTLKNDNTLEIHPNIPTGIPIICKSNKLAFTGIYNKFVFMVKENKGDTIIITDEDDIVEYKLQFETLKTYFDYAYCRTLHSVQGESLEKIKFCDEDIRFLSNEEAYTFISRFKEKVDTTNKLQYVLWY